MVLNLNISAAASIWYVLRNTTFTQRTAARTARRIEREMRMKATKSDPEQLKAAALELKKEPDQLSAREICDRVAAFTFTGGNVELSEDQVDFLNETLIELMKKGIPGEKAAAMGDLIEAIDEAKGAK